MQRTSTVLIDTLPAYIYKPFDFTYDPRKTVADATDIPEKDDSSKGTPKKETTTVTQQGSLDVDTKKYSSFMPLIDSLNKITTLSREAKAALLGQFVNETGWKTDAATNGYNYGNISAGGTWEGRTMQRGDHDEEGNHILQNFRVYGSPDEFLNDYLGLIKREYPKAYEALTAETFDINAFTDGLTTGKRKYAANPAYKNVITKMYNTVLSDLLTK